MEIQQEELEKLKKQHGKITTVIVPLDEDDAEKVAHFYLKKPGKMERKMISKLAGGSVPEKAVIAGYTALWVGGDSVGILESNYDALLSAEGALVKILEVREAEIKKN